MSILLTHIGQKGREIYETFTFESGNKIKLALSSANSHSIVNTGKSQPFFATNFSAVCKSVKAFNSKR